MSEPRTIKATFQIDNWEEQDWDARDGTAKLTRAGVTKTYDGDVEGTSTTTSVMAYAADGSATFVGVERIVGTVAGRRGTMVLRHVGSYADGAARATLTVVAGAGTDDLADAAGDGRFLADPSGSIELEVSWPGS
jgi:hypothetical protein